MLAVVKHLCSASIGTLASGCLGEERCSDTGTELTPLFGTFPGTSLRMHMYLSEYAFVHVKMHLICIYVYKHIHYTYMHYVHNIRSICKWIKLLNGHLFYFPGT